MYSCGVLALAVLATVLAVALTQTPVPARPTGFIYQTSGAGTAAEVVIEAFYDHLCSDCKNNWPILKQVFDNYLGKGVKAIIHIFPLPYHHNAYFMQQASVAVRREDLSQFVTFVDLIFQKQDMFLSGAVNMTEPQVQRIIAEVVSQNTNITYNKVLEGFTDEVVTMDARYAWKYAASRSITGTPQFIVNGVHVPTAPQFSVSDWTNFMNTLLNSPYPII